MAPGAGLTCSQAAGSALDVDHAAAHRRHPMAVAGRRAVARRACVPRLLAGGLRAVPALAARRSLDVHPGRVAGQGRCGGAGRLAGECGFHHHARASARRRRPSAAGCPARAARRKHTGPGDHALGRSRGGLSTELNLACEHGQSPLSLVLSAGQAGDAPYFEAVMAGIRLARLDGGRPRTWPQRVRADKAYSSRAICAHLRRRQIACTIPEPADQAGHRRRRGSRGGRPPSTRSTSAAGMPWSAASTASNATGGSHPVRQACRPLPGHRPHHRHQRMASPTSKHGLAAQRVEAKGALERGRGPFFAGRARDDRGVQVDDDPAVSLRLATVSHG